MPTLILHRGYADLEEKIKDLWRGAPKIEAVDKMINRARTKIRSKVRKMADHKEDFTSTRNGDRSFEEWQSGFEFAAKLPLETEVFYYKFESSGAVFFYKPETLDALRLLVTQSDTTIQEVRDFCAVASVQLS